MNTPIPEDKLTQIKEAIYRGEKILAIKLHREAAGSSLVEAKNEVEKLAAELRAASPDKFKTKAASGKGCMSVVVMVCVIICAVIVWFFR